MIRKLHAGALGAFLLSSPSFAQEITAIKAATAYLGNGRSLENAVILVQDGRIEQVGTDIEVPWNAKVLDAAYVMPAWVLAHASGGMDRENENMPVTPFLTVLDSLDPSSRFFENARRHGISTIHVMPGNATAIGGRGMVVKPYGKTPEQMAVVERAGMKVSLQPKSGSRSQQYARITKAFEDAKAHRKEHERQKREFEEDKKNGATTKTEFEGKIDPQQQPLLDLLDGKLTAYIHVPTATDVPAAMQLKRQFNLNAVFVLGADCYKAVDLLKRAHREGTPMILDSQLEVVDKDPWTEKETLVCTAKVLYDAGIPFALTSLARSSRSRRSRRSVSTTTGPALHPATEMPWWQVATCVRHGMSERAAVEAFTSIPAKILGLSKQLGSIAPGKDANLQVLSAPPMEPESQVEYLVVEGTVVYDRSKDPRLKALTGTGGAEGDR